MRIGGNLYLNVSKPKASEIIRVLEDLKENAMSDPAYRSEASNLVEELSLYVYLLRFVRWYDMICWEQ
jgi:hypothetical protein